MRPRAAPKKRTIVLFLGGALGGCTAASAPCDDGRAPRLEIAVLTGPGDPFAAVTDGQRRPLATQGQGGFHLWTSYRVLGLCAQGVLATHSGAPEGIAPEVVKRESAADLVPARDPAARAEGWLEAPAALTTLLCYSNSPPVDERRLRLAVSATDRAGRSVAAESTVVPFCAGELGPHLGDCRRLCGGGTGRDGGAAADGSSPAGADGGARGPGAEQPPQL